MQKLFKSRAKKYEQTQCGKQFQILILLNFTPTSTPILKKYVLCSDLYLLLGSSPKKNQLRTFSTSSCLDVTSKTLNNRF